MCFDVYYNSKSLLSGRMKHPSTFKRRTGWMGQNVWEPEILVWRSQRTSASQSKNYVQWTNDLAWHKAAFCVPVVFQRLDYNSDHWYLCDQAGGSWNGATSGWP